MRLAVSVCGVKLHTAKERGASPAPVAVPGGNHFQSPKTAYTTGPSGRTSQGSCFEAAITG